MYETIGYLFERKRVQSQDGFVLHPYFGVQGSQSERSSGQENLPLVGWPKFA